MREFIKYFFVGGIATIVDISVFLLLVKLAQFPWYVAAVVSFLLGTIVNYLLSIKHVFKTGARFDKRQEVILVFLVSLIGLCLNQLILGLLINYTQIGLFFSKIGATGIVFIWNFTSRSMFVFRKKTLCQSN